MPDPRQLGAAPASAATSRERGGIQSVERALLLLETLSLGGSAGISLTEIAQRTGLNISTCHHLLATMVHGGYVAQVPGRRSYALGARVLGLGQAYLSQIDLPRRAEPLVERISARTGETVHLVALQSDTLVVLLKREGRHAVRVGTGSLGAADAVHATASGKAMLAWLPEDEIHRILSRHGMVRFTPRTIVEVPQLIEELRLVRRNGYALDNEEYQPGVICVGAVVRSHTGSVVGAISSSTPTLRADGRHLALMREEVIAAARALSDFTEPPPVAPESNGKRLRRPAAKRRSGLRPPT